ncbi:ketopantoate reductase family protein, partial [Thermodesulfobacteriota bacterium]
TEGLKIVFFGSGVIGGSVGGWIASQYDNVRFLDQGKVAETLKSKGITLYHGDEPEQRETVAVEVIDDLDEARDADVIVIGVKNYSLEPVAELIREKVGDGLVIVAMQNGVVNQKILPKYFSKVIFCIVSYNAWMDELCTIGYQKKGPLYLGTLDNTLQVEMKAIARVFNLGVETHITDRLKDAAHCKLVLNLTNSLTTLIGHKYRELSDRALFQKLLTNLTWEGVRIIRAAGFRESKLGGMPPWKIIWVGARIPRIITKGIFEKNVKKMVLSSMAQDIIQRGGSESELESINGYLLALADKHGVEAPYNRTIYDLCVREFGKPGFEPLAMEAVWAAVKEEL